MVEEKFRERYEAFIRNSTEGIWLCEVDKPIDITLPPEKQVELMYKHAYMADANETMARMYSVSSAKELIGLRLAELLVKSNPKNTEYLISFVNSGYRLSGVESHERDRLGNERIFNNSLSGVIEDGKLIRAWGTQIDITAQYCATKQLQESKERLKMALDASGLGIWEWRVASNKLSWSSELKKLYGLKPGDEITYKKYKSMIHPDDRKRTDAILARAMETGREYRVEHRIVWSDGSVHWIMGQGKAFREDEKVVRMLGTSMSIDDTKRKNELEKINHMLSIQQSQLKAINETKDEFISLASHQLRTPSTAVKQYIRMILDGYCGEITDEQRKLLEVAYESNERQLHIISDLLKVAQLDAGKVVLHKRRTNLRELVDNVVEEQSENFKAKGQDISVKQKGAPVFARVDPEKFRMVLQNLVDNAHKYTSSGKNILISLSNHKNEAVIKVIDEGIGMDKNDIAKLFQKFSRLENPETRHVSGSGLGLYWAHRIIELHNGTIDITSKPKHGSTFTVKIPV